MQTRVSRLDPSHTIDKSLDLSDFVKISEKISTSLEIQNHIYTSSTIKLKQVFSNHLETLRVGESLFFPSGWKGHAVQIEVFKQSPDHLTLRI